MRRFVLPIATFLLLFFACQAKEPATTEGPKVILKLDDAWFEDGLLHPGWIQTFGYLNERGIIATIGIVGERMQDAPPAYYDWLRDQADRGHEIWNHGWCHCKPTVNGEEVREFRGTSYDYQLRHLQQTQQLAKDKLGLELSTFGAPYNAVDSITTRALAQLPEIGIWLYPPAGTSAELKALPRTPVNIEYPVHQPDFASFLKHYQENQDEPVFVIQGHPRSWLEPESRMVEFRKIVDFLAEEGADFVTPAEYFE
jgi:peptidoglycan/xylan/chitin deacetylase (PgdA/CDA1 family)